MNSHSLFDDTINIPRRSLPSPTRPSFSTNPYATIGGSTSNLGVTETAPEFVSTLAEIILFVKCEHRL